MRALKTWNQSLLFFLVCIGLGCSSQSGSGSQQQQQEQNPIPTLSTVSPTSATAGSAALTVTASGSGFISSSVMQWNGAPLTTTFVSNTSLSAQISASDIVSTGTASIAVQNPAPGGGTSATPTFTINAPPASAYLNVIDLEGTDLAWDSSLEKLYVAVPSSASSNASTITVVDPIAGSPSGSQQLTSAPSGLAISDDNHYLYAVVNGATEIERFGLPGVTPDINWSLGTDSNTAMPYLAGDIKVQPGSSHTLAVSMGDYGSGQLAIFDDASQRPATAGGTLGDLGNSLQWKPDGSELYAAYTTVNDSPYWTSVSDDALYTMPVTSAGAGTVTKYDSTFRSEGGHLHLDPTTGYLYGDWGEVINGANGTPIGNYRYSRPYVTYFQGPLSVVDPALQRFYTLLEVSEPDGTLAFQIQTFDQTQFRLLSTVVIRNAAGAPVNFIRWGNAGLAFVTNGQASNASGKLYILDGSFVNPSASPDTSAGSQLIAVPTLTSVNPKTAVLGPAAMTLNVAGRDFTNQSTLFWNGTAIPTTFVNSAQLAGQVPASNVASVGLFQITASNSTAPSPASNALPFAISDPLPSGTQLTVFDTGGNDLVWDGNAARIYVSMPGIQGDSGDAIAIVDPVAGTVSSSGFLGSDPAKLSLSANNQYLYVAFNGQNAIQQLTLPSFNVNSAWTLGGVGTFNGPYYALDLQADPESPQTTAAILANFDVSPSSAEVVIYDGSVPRQNPLLATAYPYSAVQWASNGSSLYSVDQLEPQDFLVLGVTASGPMLNQHYDGEVNPYSAGLHYDAGTGLIYTDGGQVIQPADGSIVGSYGASGIAVPDSASNRVFILGQTPAQVGTANYTIESFDQTTFTAVDSFAVENVVGTPTALIHWGTNGLAFTTRVGTPWDFRGTGPGQLYVISGNFVQTSNVGKTSSVPGSLVSVRRTWKLGSGTQRRSSPTVNRNPVKHY